MRNLQVSDLVGKTIKSVCCSRVNVTRLWFDDGTNISIWAEIVDPIGNAGLVVYDEYPENHISDILPELKHRGFLFARCERLAISILHS